MRVALTQQRAGAERMARRLRDEGVEAVVCPLIRVEPIPGPQITAAGYDWIVLTSRVGVETLFGRLTGGLPRVAAVGPGTAEALRERGVEPALVASRSMQEGLVDELPRAAGRVLFAGAEGARDTIVRALDADFVPLYRTVEVRPERFPDADVVCLASPSAARSFAALGVALPCVSIGPSTSAEAQRQLLSVVAEAETHDLSGLVRAVRVAASRTGSSPS